MCGACCRMTVTDAWTPILASTRARWETEDFANTALRHGGSRVRVTATAAGWVIRSATGQGVVVDSATALWTALLSRSEVPVDLLLALPARLQPPGRTAAPTPRRPPSPFCRAVPRDQKGRDDHHHQLRHR